MTMMQITPKTDKICKDWHTDSLKLWIVLILTKLLANYVKKLPRQQHEILEEKYCKINDTSKTMMGITSKTNSIEIKK